MARRAFKNMWFDEEKCERGINAISSYHKEFDAKNQMFRSSPKHDWSSNSSDALRYQSVTYSKMTRHNDFDYENFEQNELQHAKNVYNNLGIGEY